MLLFSDYSMSNAFNVSVNELLAFCLIIIQLIFSIISIFLMIAILLSCIVDKYLPKNDGKLLLCLLLNIIYPFFTILISFSLGGFYINIFSMIVYTYLQYHIFKLFKIYNTLH